MNSDIFGLLFIITGGIMLMLIIYFGVRDQYKSQQLIAEYNYKLEQQYDNVKINDTFVHKLSKKRFKVSDKRFNTIELTPIDEINNLKFIKIEELLSDYIYSGKNSL